MRGVLGGAAFTARRQVLVQHGWLCVDIELYLSIAKIISSRRPAPSFHSFEFPEPRPSPRVAVLLALLPPTTLPPAPPKHSSGRSTLPDGHPKRWDVPGRRARPALHCCNCRACEVRCMNRAVPHVCECSCRCFRGRPGCGYINWVCAPTLSTIRSVPWMCLLTCWSYAD